MQNGYQLIELMVVIAIIGILTALSLPHFTTHLTTTSRLQAEKSLIEMAEKLEEYQLQHNSLEGATLVALRANEFTEGKHYRIALEIKNNSYLISAIPLKQEEECGILTLDSTGKKTAEQTIKTKECWRQ